MTFNEKIEKLINISINTVLLLKKQLNVTLSSKEYIKIKEYINKNQSNILVLSEILKNTNEIREKYSNKELRAFFNEIKTTIKDSQNLK